MKDKYKLNLKTLKFERQEGVIEDFIVKKILPRFAFTVILGISLGIAATYYIGSPAEREALSETQRLNELYKTINNKLRNALVELTNIQKHDEGYRMYSSRIQFLRVLERPDSAVQTDMPI